MSSLISSSNLGHDFMQLALWFVFVGLAVAAHTAQSEEGSFALKKDVSSIKSISLNTHWLPPYRLNTDRLNTNVGLNSTKDAASTGAGFGSTPPLLLVAEPKKDDWSINIQKQIPSNNDCSPLSSRPCFDSIDEGPDNKTQHDSLWLVLRKTFHF
ncbi:MAG: hypothetical protein WBM09_07410 [Gallionella sp.]